MKVRIDIFHAVGHGFAFWADSLDKWNKHDELGDTVSGPEGWVHAATVTEEVNDIADLPKQAQWIAERRFDRSNNPAHATPWFEDDNVELTERTLDRYAEYVKLPSTKKRSMSVADVVVIFFPDHDREISMGCDSCGWRVLFDSEVTV